MDRINRMNKLYEQNVCIDRLFKTRKVQNFKRTEVCLNIGEWATGSFTNTFHGNLPPLAKFAWIWASGFGNSIIQLGVESLVAVAAIEPLAKRTVRTIQEIFTSLATCKTGKTVSKQKWLRSSRSLMYTSDHLQETILSAKHRRQIEERESQKAITPMAKQSQKAKQIYLSVWTGISWFSCSVVCSVGCSVAEQ